MQPHRRGVLQFMGSQGVAHDSTLERLPLSASTEAVEGSGPVPPPCHPREGGDSWIRWARSEVVREGLPAAVGSALVWESWVGFREAGEVVGSMSTLRKGRDPVSSTERKVPGMPRAVELGFSPGGSCPVLLSFCTCGERCGSPLGCGMVCGCLPPLFMPPPLMPGCCFQGVRTAASTTTLNVLSWARWSWSKTPSC